MLQDQEKTQSRPADLFHALITTINVLFRIRF